jgi:hypothetical protein
MVHEFQNKARKFITPRRTHAASGRRVNENGFCAIIKNLATEYPTMSSNVDQLISTLKNSAPSTIPLNFRFFHFNTVCNTVEQLIISIRKLDKKSYSYVYCIDKFSPHIFQNGNEFENQCLIFAYAISTMIDEGSLQLRGNSLNICDY